MTHANPGFWVKTCAESFNRMIRAGEVPADECAASKAALRTLVTAQGGDAREAFHRFFLEGQLTDGHLRVWDLGSMASGLEVRVPYLDRGVRDLALSLPWEQRIQGRTCKALLRAAARKVLPESMAAEIVERPKLAAPSAVRRAAEQLEHVAREMLPAGGVEPHPLHRYCATSAQRLLLDLFVYLFVGHGGDLPEGFHWKQLYTEHRLELEEALAKAVGGAP